MWWISARTQGKFVPQRKGPYKVVAILGNGTYKLADERGTLKAPKAIFGKCDNLYGMVRY